MTQWTVLLEFRTGHPDFEIVVQADKKLDAVIAAERAAVENGWADAELRKITAWPLFNRSDAA